MGRVLAILVVAAGVVWALAVSDPRGAPRGTGEAPEPAALEPTSKEVEGIPGPSPEPQAVAHDGPEPQGPSSAPPPDESADSPGPADTREALEAKQAEVLRRVREASDEQAEGTPNDGDEDPIEHGEAYASPEFREAAQRYATEPRHSVWAPDMELGVRRLLEEAGHGDRIEILNCRETTCRLQLRLDAGLDWKGLLAIDGLQQRTDLSSDTPMSLRAGVLTVHFGAAAAP